MQISPEMDRVFQQLLWIERRRVRIIESVAAHFGHDLVINTLNKEGISKPPIEENSRFVDLCDEWGSAKTLARLAAAMEKLESLTVAILRSRVSPYQNHVDEQILFGARTAGQDAARKSLEAIRNTFKSSLLSETEAVQAIFELTYNGQPGEKNYFLFLRPQGGSGVHFQRSPHLDHWKMGGCDPHILVDIKTEWMRGILDIICPSLELSLSQSIETGAPFGLAHFYVKGRHANP